MSDDLRAKDLVRDGDVPDREPLWAETTTRLMRRFWRRPAGSSAKLWKKVGGDDPFLPPKPERKILEEHRGVSASKRFVRIDKADKSKKTTLPGAQKQSRQENVPDWVVALREKAVARAAAGKSPTQVHTPSALSKAPTVRPGSKKKPSAPRKAPPVPEQKRVSPSGRLLPQRRPDAETSQGAPGRPPLIRDHTPDTSTTKAFADLDAEETDRRPPLIRPGAESSRRLGPRRPGTAPPGGAPPLIRPGDSKKRPASARTRSSRASPSERPAAKPGGAPGGAPPLVRDFQPQTGPRDPFKERFGASSAPKRKAQRIVRGAPPPGGAPPLIRDGKAGSSPAPAAPAPGPSMDDPFASQGGPSEGRTRLRPSKTTQTSKRPVVGGPPPGGAPPLHRDADTTSSPTRAPTAGPSMDDPFAALSGPSEGRTRLRAPKKDPSAQKRPVVGDAPPGGPPPLNRDAEAKSSPTTASAKPADNPKSPTKPKPKPKAKPPSGSGGMDDLFGGGPQEGRVRLGRTKAAKPEKD